MASTGLSDDVAAKVRHQVEFYFSDSNLPNDKFLLNSIQQDQDGLVSLAVVCAFMKMRSHLSLPDQTTPESVPQETLAAVAEALRSSPSLKVSEDGSKVGRSTQLLQPEEARANLYARCLAVSPFPYTVTRDDIEKFFEEHSKAYSIRMPKHQGCGVFSGYAIIEFSSAEEAQRVSELKISFKGAELKYQSRESFEKTWSSRYPGRREESYSKGLVARFKLEPLPSKAAEEKPGETKADEEMKAENGDEESKEKEAPNGDESKPADDEDVIAREDLKAVFEQYGVVKFIDFRRGDTSGFVRYETPEEQNKARTAAVVAEAGGLVVKNRVAVLEAVQGEEESEYWKNAREAMARGKKETHSNRFKGGSGRFDKRNPNPKRQKRQEPQQAAVTGKHVRLDGGDEDEPEPKLQRTG